MLSALHRVAAFAVLCAMLSVYSCPLESKHYRLYGFHVLQSMQAAVSFELRMHC